jgi:hypothetical protein
VLVQLKHADGEAEQLRVFQEAVQEVPKSGEVWCEGARMCMDPTSSSFNPDLARRYLDFALRFTPQYGDSFVEALRLGLLTNGKGLEPSVEQLCVNAEPNYGPLWSYCKGHPLHAAPRVLRAARSMLRVELALHRSVYQHALTRTLGRPADPQRFGTPSASPLPAHTFATALPSLNALSYNVHILPPSLRRKIIFGSESLTP